LALGVWAASLFASAGLAATPPAAAKPAAAAVAPALSTAEVQTELEKGLLTVPVYPVIKEYYPEVYATIIKTGLDGYLKGHTILSLQLEIRSAYLPLLKRQLPKAEPRLVYSLIEISREEAEALVNQPAACMALVGLGTFTQRLDEMISPEVAQRELKLTADILKQTATHPYAYDPALAAQAPTARDLAVSSYDQLPSDDSRRRFTMMGGQLAAAKDPADQRVVCEYMVGFFTALLKQTPDAAAAVFVGASAKAAS
jgi:hypothetical protein